ncbi:alpha/beta hydrolase [Streptomyces sp. NPDC048191]|uniref:alpha/beta fold hydrolase n=1 Tax=Streptomyces sp. NPDC048191 TaxID=3155484 RepID=UPI0033DC0763
MSQLLTLERPDNARPVRLHTERGVFAALDVTPDGHAPSVCSTALLVPGFMGSKEDFLPLLSGLSKGGVRVLAIDNRGQYETGSASSDPSYSRDDLASDLVAIAQQVNAGPVHLVGHSYGGLLARAAVLATQGDPALWESVTFMNFGPARVSAWQQERLQLLLSVVDSMTLADMWPFVRNDESSTPPDVEAFMEQRWLSNSPQQLVAAARQMLNEPDETSRLGRLSIPKSVISGTPDETWVPEGVERMASELGARFVRIEGGGHSPNVHRPAETASALLDFWLSSQEVAAA